MRGGSEPPAPGAAWTAPRAAGGGRLVHLAFGGGPSTYCAGTKSRDRCSERDSTGDSLNVPVPGLFLYLNATKYGAITDAQGGFTFSFLADWKPIRGGVLTIKAMPIPFTFKALRRQLDWRTYDPAHPLTIRLASAPGSGRPHLPGFLLKPPPVPPPVYPARSHTGRP